MTYGERCSNGSSKLLPYRGFARKVTAIPYGVRYSNGTHTWSTQCIRYAKHVTNAIALAPLQWKIKYRSSHNANQRHWNRAWLHTARTPRGAIAGF